MNVKSASAFTAFAATMTGNPAPAAAARANSPGTNAIA